MNLREGQSRQLLLAHGIHIAEACDRCTRVIGPVRWKISRAIMDLVLAEVYERSAVPRANNQFRRAGEIWQRQCDGGDARSCTIMGNLYAEGRHVTKNEDRAFELYQRACDRGSAVGCTKLASRVAATDERRALQIYRQACDAGDDAGCRLIESLRRLSAMAEACNAGNAARCYALGLAYRGGQSGVPRNDARGAEWIQQACDRGMPRDAQMYASGSGVPGDLARSTVLYERACAQGDARSCLYASGSAPSDANTKAQMVQGLLRRQSEAGHAGSCFEVGAMYLNGSTKYGVAKNVAQAVALFQKACAGGFAQACVAVSRLKP